MDAYLVTLFGKGESIDRLADSGATETILEVSIDRYRESVTEQKAWMASLAMMEAKV